MALILLAAGSMAFYLSRTGEVETPAGAYPAGRWRRIPSGTADENLARVLSLPYAQGRIPAGGRTGVTRYEPSRSQPGANLYCSGHAPEALLVDMRGEVLHRWALPFDRAFPGRPPGRESVFFRRVRLLADGGLIVLFQGSGLVRLDRDSNIVWSRSAPVFNDFSVETDGGLLWLEKRPFHGTEDLPPQDTLLEDFLVRSAPDGQIIAEISLLEAFRQPPWDQLLATMADRGDVLHSNSVSRLPPSEIAGGPLAGADFLVSMREIDAIGALDEETGEVVWASRGGWRRQHQPLLLPSGSILLFDNQGLSPGRSRVIEIEPESTRILWSYGEQPDETLFSPEGGAVSRLDNGNVLITASESGRAIEITPGREVVWEFASPHRAGQNSELIAALWEMSRVPLDELNWLERR